MKKAVIGTVHPDMIDANFVGCLVRTLTEDYDGRLVSRMPFISSRAPAGMIHVARNAVVQQFLTHPMCSLTRICRGSHTISGICWTKPDTVICPSWEASR